MLCNNATSREDTPGRPVYFGSQTEIALHKAGEKLLPREATRNFIKVNEVSFSSERKMMSVVMEGAGKKLTVFAKGAPEVLLPKCDRIYKKGEVAPMSDEQRSALAAANERLAGEALRVLGFAFKDTDQATDGLEEGLIWIGLQGMIDPPHEEVAGAIRECLSAGIRVIMITGDNPVTAGAIAKEVGLESRGAVSGPELDDMDQPALHKKLQAGVNIFARTNPFHKLRILEALGEQHDVAMTGDGVNDAPALKRADVGVAMGVKGTEVAKEAAEMVLADDNFASIAHAVEEGRRVYDNIQKSILFILPTNVAEAGVIVTAILLGAMLPITPVQILWVNMITAVTLALALTLEPSESDVMRRSPRNPRDPILSPFLLWRIGFVSLLAVAGTFGLFLWEQEQGTSIEAARTIAVNTLVVFEAFYVLNARSFYGSALSREGLFGNPYILFTIGIVLTMQGLFTYAEVMHTLFHTTGIEGVAWMRIVGIGAMIFLLVELEKYVFRVVLNRRISKVKI
jgi:calcium-translocating P-type ATPase